MRLESLYTCAWFAGASYYLAATCSAIVWGILADKLGRRPTLLAGTLGTCAANLVFGFAPSYKAAVFGRYGYPFLLSMLLSTCCVNASVLTAPSSAATQHRKALHRKSRASVFLLTMQGAQWLAKLQRWHQQDILGGVLHQGAAACCLCNLLCHVWLGFCHCTRHRRLPQVCTHAALSFFSCCTAACGG